MAISCPVHPVSSTVAQFSSLVPTRQGRLWAGSTAGLPLRPGTKQAANVSAFSCTLLPVPSLSSCSSFLGHRLRERLVYLTAPGPCSLKLKNPSVLPEWTLAPCPTFKGFSSTVSVNVCTLESSHSEQSSYYSSNIPKAVHLCACPRTLCCLSLAENQPSNAFLF